LNLSFPAETELSFGGGGRLVPSYLGMANSRESMRTRPRRWWC